MPRRTLRFLLAGILITGIALLTGCAAEGTPQPGPNDPSSAALVEEPKRYDGTEVTFVGEVIGEAMERGDKAWLHINDDAYYLKNVEEGAQLGGYNSGMPVWIAASQTEGIAFFGDYRHEGDIVEVHGTFNAACAEHGGDMDIHAADLRVLKAGHRVVDEVRPAKLAWAVGLAAGALALFVVERRRRQFVPAR